MDLFIIIQGRIDAERKERSEASKHGAGHGPDLPGQGAMLQAMETIWDEILDRFVDIWPGGLIETLEMRIAEAGTERVKALVTSGKASLEDYRKAAASWERIVNKLLNIADPDKEQTNETDI